jgi:mono/diheme cytochrome c family protein
MRPTAATVGRAGLGLVVLGLAAGSGPVRAQAVDLEDRVARLEALDGEQRAVRGARIYARSCAACHGRAGRGDGPGAADLDPAPRDLAEEGIRFRSTPTGEAPRGEDIARTIREGLPGTAMPAFGELLSGEEIEALIAFVDELRGGEIARAPVPLAIPPLPPADPAAIAEGRAIYLVTGCASCHGLDGSGRGPSASAMSDDRGRPLRMPDLGRDPLKGGRDAAAIVRTLRTGLNGAPMPSFDEAMLFAAEDLEGDHLQLLDERDRAHVAETLRGAPRRADLARMDAAGRAELRDRRLAALAHYVLSLERRTGLAFRLLHERPELGERTAP